MLLLSCNGLNCWAEYGGQMLPAGFELFSPQAQPVIENAGHKGVFLLGSVVLAALEEQPLIGALHGPCAHSEAELNVRLDFSGVGCTVEQPELYRALGEEGVEVNAVVPAGIIVLMVNAACIPVIHSAVPYPLQAVPGLFGVFLHGLKEAAVHFPAPMVGPAADIQRLIEQILPADGEAH